MATSSPVASSASERAAFSVGLTGGIGSGKSLVADLLGRHGAAIIDTDAIAHRLTAPGGDAIESLATAFGPQFIDAQGALDRGRMRQLVFADPAAKSTLESILHPLIRAEAEREAAAAAGAPYVVFVVPLLVESGSWSARVRRVLVVDCPLQRQVERVAATRGLTPPQVEAIVAQQASRAQRLAVADDVLVNDASPDDLAPRVARLHTYYCALAAATRDAAQGL
jgi:dephospho-CoA kinase